MKWIKVRHDKDDSGRLPDHIAWETELAKGIKLIIWSHPYGYGEFTYECDALHLGGKYAWLGTKDENEAKKRAESIIKTIAEDWVSYWKETLEIINDSTATTEDILNAELIL